MNLTDLGLPIPSSNASGLIISKSFYVPSLTGGNTFYLDPYAVFGYTVTGVYGIKTSSGTVTAAIKIGTTSVTFTGSVTTISVNDSAQSIAAISNNVVVVGNVLTIEFSSASSPEDIRFTLAATRT